MNNMNTRAKSILQVALLAVLASLAGCGGDDDSGAQICMILLVIPVPCSAGTPVSEPASTQTPPPAETSPPPAETSGSTSSGGERSLAMNRVNEYEPNNTLNNANVVQFLTAPMDTSVGIDIKGNVHDTDDQADFFIFTPDRSGSYLFYLCADTCAEFVEDDAVYVMLYDQYQTTIVSTPVGTVAEQVFSAELTAGLAYYVEVHGVSTASMSYAYQLVIIN